MATFPISWSSDIYLYPDKPLLDEVTDALAYPCLSIEGYSIVNLESGETIHQPSYLERITFLALGIFALIPSNHLPRILWEISILAAIFPIPTQTVRG